jgi:membrane protein implicated in regulation of membrane protease activity
MEQVYLVSAVFGGTLWVCLFLLSMFGADHAHGADTHGHGDYGEGFNWLIGLFNVRGLIAGVMFFGIGGLAASYTNVSPVPGLAIAIISALAAMAMVSAVVRLLLRTEQDGTLQIRNAVGKVGIVYLRVPAAGTGRGKVTVKVQDRLVELQAVSKGPELSTGSQVVVVSVVGPDTVEVIPAVI